MKFCDRRLLLIVIAISCLESRTVIGDEAGAEERPNILFISIDDLNDWIGCLGGHPQAALRLLAIRPGPRS